MLFKHSRLLVSHAAAVLAADVQSSKGKRVRRRGGGGGFGEGWAKQKKKRERYGAGGHGFSDDNPYGAKQQSAKRQFSR